jgi:hypothetical protein
MKNGQKHFIGKYAGVPCQLRTLNIYIAPNLKFTENWESKDGIFRITLKFQVISWDIYYFSERL